MDGEKSNEWVLENIEPEWTLESRATRAAVSYFEQVVREERGMANDVILWGMNRTRRRWRPRKRWRDINKPKTSFR